MELVFLVYLISLFDSLHAGYVIIVAALMLLAIGICYGIGSDFDRDSEMRKRWEGRGERGLKIWGYLIPILFVLTFLAPNKETSYTMLAAYGVQTVSEAPEVREVMGKSVQVLEKYMDNYLGESVDKESEND